MTFTVEYSADENSNHKAPLYSCFRTLKKTFDNEIQTIMFINECTYVYNLIELKKKFSSDNISLLELKINNINLKKKKW